MKKWAFYIFFLFPPIAPAQTISTVAGNGLPGNSGDGGPATAASIDYPVSGVFDKYGNYYLATGSTGNSIRKIAPDGIITTLTLTGTGGFNGDGIPATVAQLNNPQGVTVDTLGNIYFTDDFNSRIRKIDISTGLISTICGTGTNGFSGDGTAATGAQIFGPLDICFDKFGNLYFADYGNSRVRKINTSGMISTYAGGGSGTGDSGPATAAGLGAWGLCTDNSNNLYIADGSKKIHKVNATGIISTYVGTNVSGYSGDGGPATAAQTEAYYVKVDKFGNLYISETGANTIRLVNSSGIINTIAGNYGIAGFTGDGGPASAARLNYPAGLALDTCSNLYISGAHDFHIRKITYPHCNSLEILGSSDNKEFSVYPNPSYDQLNINNLKTPSIYRLLSILGTIRQQGTLREGNNTISIQSIPNGIYMLEITDKQKNRTVSKISKQ